MNCCNRLVVELCCCSLETGSKVIGVFQILVGLLVGVFGCYELLNRNMDPIIREIDPQYQAETLNWIMGTASSLFAVLISSLLVAGASQRRRDLVLPWLVAEAIRLICSTSYIINAISVRAESSSGLSAVEIVTTTLPPAILFYLWLVVYYFYQELKLNLSNSMSYVDESYINGTPNHTSVTILVGAAV